MKLKKKSGLMGAVIALSAASLVSVGFASWVISQGDSKTAQGTISVEEVSDDRHVVTATWVDSDVLASAAALGSNPVVSYGSNSTATTGWLQNTDGTPEALVFYLKVNVTNIDSDAKFIEKVSLVMTADSGYDAAVGHDYVGSLPALGATAGNGVGTIVKGTGAADGDNWQAIYTITFVWGEAFNFQNPYDYFNASGKTAATDGDEALTKLGGLKTDLTGVGFIVTVSAAA